MKEWIEEFEKGIQLLDEIKQKEEFDAIFRELEWMKELTLDTWTAMDEQLEKRCTKKQQEKNRLYRSRGTAYYELQMYEHAAEYFVAELKQFEHPLIRLYAGFSFLYSQKLDQAKTYFYYVYQYSGNERACYFALCGLAEIHVQLKQYEEAVHHYEKALLINSHPDVVYNLGMCFFHMNKPKLAIPYIEQFLRLNPNDYGAYYLLGRCFILLDDKKSANSTWLCALQLTSAKSDLLAIAYEFEEMGHYLASIHCYKRLLQCGYRDENIVHGLAWNYGLLDERELSIKWFQQLFNQLEINPTVWLSFIWLLKKWDDKQLINEYQEEIERFIMMFPQYHQLLEG